MDFPHIGNGLGKIRPLTRATNTNKDNAHQDDHDGYDNQKLHQGESAKPDRALD